MTFLFGLFSYAGYLDGQVPPILKVRLLATTARRPPFQSYAISYMIFQHVTQ